MVTRAGVVVQRSRNDISKKMAQGGEQSKPMLPYKHFQADEFLAPIADPYRVWEVGQCFEVVVCGEMHD